MCKGQRWLQEAGKSQRPENVTELTGLQQRIHRVTGSSEGLKPQRAVKDKLFSSNDMIRGVSGKANTRLPSTKGTGAATVGVGRTGPRGCTGES